jgi:hypothetical protein
MKIKNIYKGLKEQLPWKRFFRNFFITGNAWGMFSKRSHYREDGKPKQIFPKKESAERASISMSKKHGKHFGYIKNSIIFVVQLNNNNMKKEKDFL